MQVSGYETQMTMIMKLPKKKQANERKQGNYVDDDDKYNKNNNCNENFSGCNAMKEN